jgi:hypothetical protein
MVNVSGDPTYVVAEDMRNLPEALRKKVRPKIRQAVEIVAADARTRAGWSSRIPATVRIRTSFRTDREQVSVDAGGKNAPHARPYEGLGRNPFRHPVYGNREVWVPQAARPFLMPAARAHRATVDGLLQAAFAEAAQGIGF